MTFFEFNNLLAGEKSPVFSFPGFCLQGFIYFANIHLQFSTGVLLVFVIN